MNLIKKEDGYSFYENPDAELKAKIQAFPKPDYMREHGREKWFYRSTAANGKFITESEAGDIKTFSEDTYNDELQREHIALINKEFSVMNTFNKHFAPFESGESMIVEVTDKCLFMGRGFNGSVDSIYDLKKWSTGKSKNAYLNGTSTQRITFEVDRGIRTGSLYFAQDGDIANRDYNYDLNFKEEFIPIEKTLKKFYSLIKAYPDLEYANDKWFTNDYALDIRVSQEHGDLKVVVYQTPNQGTSYYVQGQSTYKFKKPKVTQTVTSQHLLDAVKAAMEPHKGLIEN